MFQFSGTERQIRVLTFPFPVWKLRIDPESGWMAVELRDPERKGSGLWTGKLEDLETAEIVEEELKSPPASWWWGLEGVFGDYMFFHGYESEDLPVPGGIKCWATESGAELWSQPNLRLHALTVQGLLCGENASPGQKRFLLDFKSGNLLREFADDQSGREESGANAYASWMETQFAFPKIVQPGHAAWQAAEKHASGHLVQVDSLPGGGIARSEKNADGTYDQLLEVPELPGDIALSRSAERLALDTFFGIGNQLIALANQNEIWIVS